ncbi:MAG: peptidoglycan-binding protein [Bryobacteraceae bacterium]|nr:peptidoglycan-binding protein [Bryobacteraceae bacterium]
MANATGILAVLLALGLMAAGAAQNSTSAAKKNTAAPPAKSAAAAKPKAAGPSKSGSSSAATRGQAASKGPSKSASGKTGQAKASTAAKASAKNTAKRTASRSKRRRPARPAVQQQPTPERYREIQRALVDRGFLEGEPTGRWDSASIEALKRFQADQQLQPTGKIDALSLIRLGLGPRRQNLALAPSPSQSSEVQTEP